MKMEENLEQLPDSFLRSLGEYVIDHVVNVPKDKNKLVHRWETGAAEEQGVRILDVMKHAPSGDASLFTQVLDAFTFDFLVDNCDRFSSSRKGIEFEMGYDRLLQCTTPACKRWGLFNYNEKNFLFKKLNDNKNQVSEK